MIKQLAKVAVIPYEWVTLYTGTLKKYDVFAYTMHGDGYDQFHINGSPIGVGDTGPVISAGTSRGFLTYIGEDVEDAIITVHCGVNFAFELNYGWLFLLRGAGQNSFVNAGDSGQRLLTNIGSSITCEVTSTVDSGPVEIECRPGSWAFMSDYVISFSCSTPLMIVSHVEGISAGALPWAFSYTPYIDSYGDLEYAINNVPGQAAAGVVILWPAGQDDTLEATVTGNTLDFISNDGAGAAIRVVDSDKITVSDNTLSRCNDQGIVYDGVIYGNISNNSLIYCAESAIELHFCEAVNVNGNVIANASSSSDGTLPAILLADMSYGNYVTSNNIRKSTSAFGPPITESGDPQFPPSLVSYGVRLDTGVYDNSVAFNSMLGAYALDPVSNAGTNNFIVDNLPTIGEAGDTGDHNHTGPDDGGILSGDKHDSYSEYAAILAPTTPAAGNMLLYARTVDSITRGYLKLDNGTEIEIGSGGGASLIPAHYDFQPEFPNAIFVPGSIENGTLVPFDDTTDRFNAYHWTTSEASDQTIDIILRWRLSPRFSAWTSDFKMLSKVSNGAGTNSVELVEFLDTAGVNAITPAEKKNAAWTEDSFTVAAGTWDQGGICTLRFRLHAVSGENAYLGPVQIAFDEE